MLRLAWATALRASFRSIGVSRCMRRSNWAAVGAFLLAQFQPSAAFACLCGRNIPAIELAGSEAVFTGTVVALTLLEGPVPAVRVELRVIERIKGTQSGRVIVYMRAPAPLPKPLCSTVVDPVS